MSGQINVLIVDDSLDISKAMALILDFKGFNVTIASDGIQALTLVKQDPFDIIFLDIKMPVMNGVETFKRIKKIKPEIVVIMMTAYSVEELIQEALEEGAYAILYKPIDPEKFISLIEKTIEKKKGGLILIVDGDIKICTTLKNLLSKQGYLINIVHTGEDAIRIAQENNFDIVLIDIKLPSINGLVTFLEIKKVNSKVVVIMMTGHPQEDVELIEEALKNGAYTCLYKPLNMELLLKIIDNIFKSKK